MYWEMEWKSVWLIATPRAVGRQAPLSKGFSRQEYWSGLPCPPPGDQSWVSCVAGILFTVWGNVKQTLSQSPATAAIKDGDLLCWKRTREVKTRRKLRKWKQDTGPTSGCREKSILTPGWNYFCLFFFFCFCYYNHTYGQPRRILPLYLSVKLEYFCSGHCPPVDG